MRLGVKKIVGDDSVTAETQVKMTGIDDVMGRVYKLQRVLPNHLASAMLTANWF